MRTPAEWSGMEWSGSGSGAKPLTTGHHSVAVVAAPVLLLSLESKQQQQQVAIRIGSKRVCVLYSM